MEDFWYCSRPRKFNIIINAGTKSSKICSSVGSHVNTTESKLCGIPTTPSSNTTSSENMTTGAEAPPPAANPSTGE
ncbi:MAG: hypothetical protein ACJ719_08425 [Nitrososphaeraceae archaeon]